MKGLKVSTAPIAKKEYEPNEKQLEMLKAISESPNTTMSRPQLRAIAKEARTKADYNIGELEKNNLINSIGTGDDREPRYTVTHEGRRALIERGVVL